MQRSIKNTFFFVKVSIYFSLYFLFFGKTNLSCLRIGASSKLVGTNTKVSTLMMIMMIMIMMMIIMMTNSVQQCPSCQARGKYFHNTLCKDGERKKTHLFFFLAGRFLTFFLEGDPLAAILWSNCAHF